MTEVEAELWLPGCCISVGATVLQWVSIRDAREKQSRCNQLWRVEVEKEEENLNY